LKTTVYADVLFLVNFIINYLLMYITMLLSKSHTKVWRLVLSSVIGAVYSVCMFIPQVTVLGTFVSKALLSFVMVYVAFFATNIKTYFKQLCFFYLVSLMCAGVVMALSSMNSNFIISKGPLVYINTGTLSIIIAAVISYFVIKTTFGIYKKISLRDYLSMVIYKDGKAVNITVLVDTGNLLIDPIGGGPVIVAEQKVLSPIVGVGDVYQRCNKISGMRLIPIQTVGCDNGLLVGFKPDKICCRTPVRDDAIIAVAPNSFNADYNALAGPHSFFN